MTTCPIGRGDLTGYKVKGCRCRPCKDAASAQQRRWTRQVGYHGHLTITGDDADKVRDRIAALQGLGWTLAQIAELAGCAPSTLSNVLNGRKNPHRDTARGIDHAWDVLTGRNHGMTRNPLAGRGNQHTRRRAA
ncbi:helix-turn-helix domain-containing protein [Nesterenkonia sp. PF2B19]|uniref:helix-turn-helix domain-containing protein n=1 Tax=Nesterenkonia sp. PF2B19 TaxID=1881858 RepID=UPI000872ACFA|nr:helix-turn-helix transcriptional regulator [Nesterenkonia sp. PF2B19]OSM43488.1 hypothetical protein BCY76_008190 [Nesterenkonia sp. PF2B19]